MKSMKIPYSAAELEVIFFFAEDLLTTSNMEVGGKGGVDWNDVSDEDWSGDDRDNW